MRQPRTRVTREGAPPVRVMVGGEWRRIRTPVLREFAELVEGLEYQASLPHDRADSGQAPTGVMIGGAACELADVVGALNHARRMLQERMERRGQRAALRAAAEAADAKFRRRT